MNSAGISARSEIQVNNRQLRDVTSDAWNAIHQANGLMNDPGCRRYLLFRQGNSLAQFKTDEAGDVVEIQHATEASVFGLLVQVSNWIRITKDAAIMQVAPTADLPRITMSYPNDN